MSDIKDDEVANNGMSHGRIRHVPFYKFQFRCEERAVKRKEFSFKLKEIFYKKELERAMLLTKLKEIEEEEIKMLRKSMVVRANPVPDFYHRLSPPPSPKVEFNNTPPTTAKSPKLGHGRMSTPARG
ncbi:hypothetical protein MLD38_014830 [Melastoma candidum]|uniref:Uncharacterized protein n=1 Tax=Melastoma candidum TaxID=119954 RepID=A0ACB9REL4_9MYRT|nr:hypothetical protein MLD38_014830 [Melastoma candidum]